MPEGCPVIYPLAFKVMPVGGDPSVTEKVIESPAPYTTLDGNSIFAVFNVDIDTVFPAK